jgi:hypothetical protein
VDWTFVYLMLGLKIPIIGLLWIVWWAIKSAPEPVEPRDDGGAKVHPHRDPRRPRPRCGGPRRDPHGARNPLPPPRIRTVQARARRASAR